MTVEDFDRAMAERRFEDADSMLRQVRGCRTEFPDWTDVLIRRCEYLLFTRCCEHGWGTGEVIWYKLAKRIVEDPFDPHTAQARRKHLEEVSRIPYDRI